MLKKYYVLGEDVEVLFPSQGVLVCVFGGMVKGSHSSTKLTATVAFYIFIVHLSFKCLSLGTQQLEHVR